MRWIDEWIFISPETDFFFVFSCFFRLVFFVVVLGSHDVKRTLLVLQSYTHVTIHVDGDIMKEKCCRTLVLFASFFHFFVFVFFFDITYEHTSTAFHLDTLNYIELCYAFVLMWMTKKLYINGIKRMFVSEWRRLVAIND